MSHTGLVGLGRGRDESILSWVTLVMATVAAVMVVFLLVPALLEARHFIVSIPPTPYWDQFHTVIVQRIEGMPRYVGEGVWLRPKSDATLLYYGLVLMAYPAFMLSLGALLRGQRSWTKWTSLALSGFSGTVFLSLLPWVREGLVYNG